MGQTASTPQQPSKPPPLSDDTDDSEEDEALLLDKILAEGNGGKEDEVSIVFFDEDQVDETDLYYDEDRNDSFMDDFKCFGLPLFSMHTHFAAVTSPSKQGNQDDEDEDPKENIESLQLELKVVDAFYNHHTRNSKKKSKTSEETKEEDGERETNEVEDSKVVVEEVENTETPNDEVKENEIIMEKEDNNIDEDEDPKENVESLQRELERAEENFEEHKDRGAMNASPVSGGDDQSQRSSSFIDLQQLLFSSSPANDEDDNNSLIPKNGGSVSSSSISLFSSSSTSSKSCRIVEIYETRTTQLKPQREDEKEQVPIERRGIPFRKCRDPSCSCHRPSPKHRDMNKRSRHRDRNRAIIEKYHGGGSDSNLNDRDCNDEGDDSSTVESGQRKRRSALMRLQKQREKLLAMDYLDDDDCTEATVGSSSTRYSGYSIRSDCQINTRKNHMIHNNSNNSNPTHSDRGHKRQQSRSEDFDERFTNSASFLRERHRVISPETLPLDAISSLQKISSSKAVPEPIPSNNSHMRNQRKQQQQQPTPPPIPSRRSFGGGDNHKHTTYPSLLAQQGNQSLRKISSESIAEDINEIPRRCRSEDFIDGTTSNGDMVKSPGTAEKSESSSHLQTVLDGNSPRVNDSTTSPNSSGKKRSFSAHAAPDTIHGPGVVPTHQEVDRATPTEVEDLTSLRSPTCIMEEVERNGSYPRSRTTQHQHEHLMEKLDRIHQQEEGPNSNPTADRKSSAKAVTDDDNPSYSRLFYLRERNLKDYRKSIRILLNEEKMDRCQNSQNAQKRFSRKQQKRSRHQQQQRRFQRAMKLADLYHNMGLIHYQQGRYETARHVLQCGVDALISNRASCIPLDQEVFHEESDPFDEDYSNPYFACAPSRLLPLLPTLDEAAPHLSNAALLLAAELILTQGKILAAQGLWNDTKLSSGRVLQWSAFQKQRLDNSSHQQQNHYLVTEQHNKYWKDWGPTIARAQVLFARCCEKERRPDIAMGYYREALSVQQSILSPGHIQAADTLYRMGNLHANSGLLGLAGQCYDEALCLYRRHKRISQNEVESCLCADEATALAALGWIFFVQNDLERARALTNEALDGMVQVLGSSHRNVLALKHQLICIQNALAFPTQQYPNRGFIVQAPPQR